MFCANRVERISRRRSTRCQVRRQRSRSTPRGPAVHDRAPENVLSGCQRAATTSGDASVTSYGVSYTDREEEKPDPERDRRFGGARAGWDYTEHLNPATTFDSELGANVNFADAFDYSFNTLNALTVSINSRVSIKVSLQWLFENEPALESDLDVIAYASS